MLIIEMSAKYKVSSTKTASEIFSRELNFEKVDEIRNIMKDNNSDENKEIVAKKYGITLKHLNGIIENKSWKKEENL